VAPTRGGVAKARIWAALPDPAPGAKDPLYVSFLGRPDAEALAAAASFVAALEAKGLIARSPENPGPDTTHAIERDARGHRRLVRKRFSVR
jgi:hypothetical protein